MPDTFASRGFTLIEVIVTVTLMLLMSGFLIAGYNGFNSSQAVVQAAENLKSNLILARTEAASGSIPMGENCDVLDVNGVPTGNELIGYEIRFISETQYTSVALCTVGGSPTEVGDKATYSLPKTVKFSPVPGPLIFYVLGRGASQNLTITLQGIYRSINVLVSPSGSISQ